MKVMHTAGPWSAEEDRIHRWRIAQTDSPNPFVLVFGAGIHIATDLECDAERNQEVAANARLIAAAPDLLEALRGLTDECEIAGYGTDKDFDWPKRMKAAHAAIAKALGETK